MFVERVSLAGQASRLMTRRFCYVMWALKKSTRSTGTRRKRDPDPDISFLATPAGAAEISLQIRVLRLGLLQDGDVGIGAFQSAKKS